MTETHTETQPRATRAATVRLANRAHAALADLPGAERAFDLAAEGERRHRKGAPRGYSYRGRATVDDCAALFTARWLAEYALRPDKIPTLADSVRMRPDAVHCAAIVQREGPAAVLDRLTGAGLAPAEVAALDYVAAVRGRGE
jgi:hypothetical protein